MAQFLCKKNQMIIFVVSVVVSVTVLVEGQDNLAYNTTAVTTSSEKSIDSATATGAVDNNQSEIQQCEMYAQSLLAEKKRLRAELDSIKAAIEAAAMEDMEQEDESNESHSRSRGIRGYSRGKRGTSACEGGTVAQWACGSQCIFKLKGLCGLSLRAMCHC